MKPILLELGPIKIYSFGTFIALGALAAGAVLYYAFKQRKISTKYLFDLVLIVLLVSLLAARATFFAAHQNQFQNYYQILLFWQGGMASIGGILAGLLAFILLSRRYKLPTLPVLDAGIMGLLAGWAVGRLGCHLSNCTLGRTGAWQVFANGYPVDLISAVWAVLLLAGLYWLWREQKLQAGVLFFLGLEGFFLGELLIKTLRVDFTEAAVRNEAVGYLLMVIVVYMIFWRLYGPPVPPETRKKIRSANKIAKQQWARLEPVGQKFKQYRQQLAERLAKKS